MISSIPKIGESVHQIAEEKQGEVFGSDYLNQEAVGLKKFYIESYGCQMNFSDSEIVASILSETGFTATRNVEMADLILINTCSIREKAEETVRKRLQEFKIFKKKKDVK